MAMQRDHGRAMKDALVDCRQIKASEAKDTKHIKASEAKDTKQARPRTPSGSECLATLKQNRFHTALSLLLLSRTRFEPTTLGF